MKPDQNIQFIGKCLTLGKYPERAPDIRQTIEMSGFSWEQTVYQASNEYVLTAWFLKMKHAGLLERMPAELFIHLEELNQLNRERNRGIVKQAYEMAAALNREGIAPIFLKGTAHLLIGLYEDPSERLVGDIDFLVAQDEMVLAAEIMRSLNFVPVSEHRPAFEKKIKHYPRMIHESYPAAVEIHRELLVPPYDRHLNSKDIFLEKQQTNAQPLIHVPGKNHLIRHNILNAQINDKSYAKASLLLRQRYDFFLLSIKYGLTPQSNQMDRQKRKENSWVVTTGILL
ncbi:MAG: nucleotidyltransferase family protein, partial [Marinilabiliales bacterium]|nr:nucleotidyltransferase family protein [Marinilabiliales bacterium]